MMNRLTRELAFEDIDASLDANALIPVTIATSTAVRRFGVLEILDCTASGVDLGRAPLPLITSHDSTNLAIGLVEQLHADGARVTGLVRFGSSTEAQQIRTDILGGIHRSVSVGYVLLDEGTPVDGGMVYRWQPYEVSIVSIPADPAAGFFRSTNGVHKMTMPAPQTRDALEIVKLCRAHKVEELTEPLLERGLTLDQARTEILGMLAKRDYAAGGHLNLIPHNSSSELERSLIENTLVARLGGKPKGDIITAIDMTGLAVRSLRIEGYSVADRDSRDKILQRAFGMQTTGDFPLLLGNAVGRVLHEAYEQAPAALKAVSRLSNLPDFRAKSVVRLGGAPSLERVNEHGEYKYGAIKEAGSTWSLSTFGRIVALTRQAMVNDDLGGFSDLITKFGQAAAQREADELVAVLTGAPTVEGAPLFSVERSSLITNVLNLAGLGAAVIALRAQKDLGGALVIQEPATIVVPSALEMTAKQLVASISPAQSSNVQPFNLSVVVESRLDAISKTAWYLVAARQTALEHGYLDGAQGIHTEQQNGFDVDGLAIKARLDFGCGWASPIGWVKSSGV